MKDLRDKISKHDANPVTVNANSGGLLQHRTAAERGL